MLIQEDKEKILSEFPNIKLSYEIITHKKVYDCDIILAIPSGTKCFSWFTTYNDKFVCMLIELENNNKKEIKNIRIINACFSKSLCYGTIFYGTLFNHMNNSFFSIEDIFLYKNRDFSGENWNNKFNKIIEILRNEIKQISYNKNFIVFGLPIIAYTNSTLHSKLQIDIKYKINCIQYYQSNKQNSYTILSFDNFINTEIKELKEIKEIREMKELKEAKQIDKTPKFIVLEIRPDIQNDIYNLYCFGNISCGIACIPDYKTSIAMNKLFRNIKENDDLDKLEESDDDEEFENPNLDKFVYLDKSYKMKCRYNKKFKKWLPVEVVYNIELSSINDIANFIKNIISKPMKNYK